VSTISLARPVVSGVTTLGHGRRVVVWTQGCTLACSGCMSRDTWPGETADTAVQRVDELADLILRLVESDTLDGLTVSGGEPFQQAAAVAELVERVRVGTRPDRFDLLVYSGYTLEHLRGRGDDHRQRVLASVDVLVDGRFREGEPTDASHRGSANQRLHRFTELARLRYSDADEPRSRPSLQVVATGDALTWIGIPRRGELDQHRAALAESGLALEGTSW
jgi:anaerobic ribonucleoside-triphosphate reductase activating protein